MTKQILPLVIKFLFVFFLFQAQAEAKILYTAEEILKTQAFDKNSNVVVVLIHGYKGDPLRWRNFCDFLARDFGRKINVYICKYPASGTTTIRAISRHLSMELDQEFGKRAVHVFLVCHSMGGLVAKNADLSAKHYIEGICYIATPHDGTDIALMELLLFGVLPKNAEQKEHFQELIGELLIGYGDCQELRARSFVVVGTKSYFPQPPDFFVPGKVLAEALHRLMGIDNANDGIVPRSSAQGRKNGPDIRSGAHYAEFYLNHGELAQDQRVYFKIFHDFFKLRQVLAAIRPYQKLPLIKQDYSADPYFQKSWQLFTQYRIIQEILSDPTSGIVFQVSKMNRTFNICASTNSRYRPEKEVGRYLEVMDLFSELGHSHKIPGFSYTITGFCFNEDSIVSAQEKAEELDFCSVDLNDSKKYLVGYSLVFDFPQKVNCVLLVITYRLDGPAEKFTNIKTFFGKKTSLPVFNQAMVIPKGKYLVCGFHFKKEPPNIGTIVAWPDFYEIITVK
jgi:pimeloyl-ACP methyl ester carboxylesterase